MRPGAVVTPGLTRGLPSFDPAIPEEKGGSRVKPGMTRWGWQPGRRGKLRNFTLESHAARHARTPKVTKVLDAWRENGAFVPLSYPVSAKPLGRRTADDLPFIDQLGA